MANEPVWMRGNLDLCGTYYQLENVLTEIHDSFLDSKEIETGDELEVEGEGLVKVMGHPLRDGAPEFLDEDSNADPLYDPDWATNEADVTKEGHVWRGRYSLEDGEFQLTITRPSMAKDYFIMHLNYKEAPKAEPEK